jgi:hypothetical protein
MAALATEAPPAVKSNGSGAPQGPIVLNGQVGGTLVHGDCFLIGFQFILCIMFMVAEAPECV